MRPSSPSGAPVAETFQRELEQLQEKEKELKGEQRKFFGSIVERVKNNVDCLASLREEHATLRARLTKLTKMERLIEPNLEHTLKHRTHEVNLLVKQIDMLKHKREEAIKRQGELEIILGNFQSAATCEHPELDRIQVLQNKLDKANIKNAETKHLMKIYQGIINQFDRQQMLWNPIVREQQQEIEKKHRDISELSLIARDSKHSRATAKTELTRTQKVCNENRKRRDRQLKVKKQMLVDMGSVESTDHEPQGRPVRAQASIGSTASQLRNKMNKQLRERREEKFRAVSVEYEKIREAFGTNDPKEIQGYFDEKRRTTECLNQQIADLKKSIKAIRKEIDRVKLEIEEQEFTTARGVGNTRMMREGRQIQDKTKAKLKKQERKIEAFHDHQKQVCAGIAHLVDMLSLVTQDETTIPTNFPAILDWVTEKATHYQEEIENEDAEFMSTVNQQVYCQYKNRGGVPEEEVKKPRRETTFRRLAKDQKGDVQTRVLDRNAVKAAAAKAVQLAQQQQQRRPVGRR